MGNFSSRKGRRRRFSFFFFYKCKLDKVGLRFTILAQTEDIHIFRQSKIYIQNADPIDVNKGRRIMHKWIVDWNSSETTTVFVKKNSFLGLLMMDGFGSTKRLSHISRVVFLFLFESNYQSYTVLCSARKFVEHSRPEILTNEWDERQAARKSLLYLDDSTRLGRTKMVACE